MLRVQQIEKKSLGSATGTISLNTTRKNVAGLHVHHLLVNITADTAGGAAKTILQAGYGFASRVSARFRDGSAWIENVPMAELDYLAAVQQNALAIAPAEVIDRTFTTGAGIPQIMLLIPVCDAKSKDADDLLIPWDEIDTIDISFGSDTGTATITNWTAELYAVGPKLKDGEIKLGVRAYIQSRAMDASGEQDISLGGRLLSDLYLVDSTGTNPVAGAGGTFTAPQIYVDGDMVENGLDATDLGQVAAMRAEPNYRPALDATSAGATGNLSGVAFAGFVPAIVPRFKYSLTELPSVGSVKVKGTASYAAGSVHCLVRSFYINDAETLRKRREALNLGAVVAQRDQKDSTVPMGAAQAARLPATIKPQA